MYCIAYCIFFPSPSLFLPFNKPPPYLSISPKKLAHLPQVDTTAATGDDVMTC